VLSQTCPACAIKGQFGKHAIYQKYHFAEHIDIQRVRCHSCGTTHSLIPSFSVPDTSLGTKEAEGCLIARLNGASRAVAARPLIEQGMESRSGKRLEKMLGTAVARGKAIWPEAAELTLEPLAWIHGVCGRVDHPILDMNRWALDHGINAMCFCRSSILFFGPGSVARVASLKPDSAAGDEGASIVAIISTLSGGTP
jgi:hypothetical protein